jgi:hypothetical protein
MSAENGNGIRREREWLVWLTRAIMVAMAGWTLYTVQQSAVSIEGVRVLVVTQGERLTALEAWRNTAPLRR